MTTFTTVWIYFKAALMVAGPAAAFVAYSLLGSSVVTNVVFIGIAWIQIHSLLEMNAHTRIKFAGAPELVSEIMSDSKYSELVRKLELSGTPDKLKEDLAKFGQECFEQGNHKAILRYREP